MQTNVSLMDRIWPVTGTVAKTTRATVLILVGSVLLALSAHIQIPFWPVPMTMESFVVLMLGLGYAGALGSATVFAFLVEGALGFPVFVHGAGLAYFAGPTGGYLVGFLAAALLLGEFRRRGWTRSIPGTLASALIADIAIFVFGVAWLSVLIGFDKAVAVGVVPFVLGDALKVLVAGLSVGVLERAGNKTA